MLGSVLEVSLKLGEVIGGAIGSLMSATYNSSSVLGLDEAEGRFESIQSYQAAGRLLFYYWIEDAVPLLMLLNRDRPNFCVDVAYVCGGTYLGEITSNVLAGRGRRIIPIRFSGNEVRIADLQSVIREPSCVSISADGSGPFGRVHPSLGRLVAARRALAIPLAARASSAWRTGGIAIPTPTAQLAFAMGSPVVDDEMPSAAALERGLRAAGYAADSLLSQSVLPG